MRKAVAMDLQRVLGERHPLAVAENRLRAIEVNLITAVGTGLVSCALVLVGLIGQRMAFAAEVASAIVEIGRAHV